MNRNYTDDGLTGRQLIALFLAFAIALALTPVAAQAAATLVHIGDSKTRAVARVDKTSLLTEPTPGKPFSGKVHMSVANVDDSLSGSAPMTSGTKFDVTSLSFANDGTTNLQARVRTENTSATCTTGIRSVVSEPVQVVVPAGQTVSMPFPTPLVVTGQCLTVLLQPNPPPVGSDMYVMASGYLNSP